MKATLSEATPREKPAILRIYQFAKDLADSMPSKHSPSELRGWLLRASVLYNDGVVDRLHQQIQDFMDGDDR